MKKKDRKMKNIVAEQLSSPRFFQRIVADKTKYKRNKKVDSCSW